MQAQVVAETEQDDGMVDLTIEMDEEFEATARAAANAAGKTLEDWMRDAVIAAVQDRIDAAKDGAAGTEAPNTTATEGTSV
jgi:uncharacterized protein (DUF1778 family)